MLYFLFNFSYVDVTGTDVTGEMEVEAIIVDPFSKSRIGNESNPFVDDVETGHVSVPDDSDDRQELNERLSKMLFDLQDDGSELSGGESESEQESEEDSRTESKEVSFEPVISDNKPSRCHNPQKA